MRSENRPRCWQRTGRSGRWSRPSLALVFLALAGGVGAAALAGESPSGGPWIGPGGEPLPFRNDAEVEEFLRDARVVHSEVLGKGINKPTKVLLEREGVRAHAVWRTVDQQYAGKTKGRFRHFLPFRDSYSFELAAYRFSRLLGLTLVPPVVERDKGHDSATLQLWVEGAIDERERRLSDLTPREPQRWLRQKDAMAVFDALIQNDDRNQGNFLIDARWNLWLIDHTRAFVPDTRLRDPERLRRCPEELWQRLRTLDRGEVRRALSADLNRRELEALFVRWEKIVAHFESLIAERGEEQVLFQDELPAAAVARAAGRRPVGVPFGP